MSMQQSAEDDESAFHHPLSVPSKRFVCPEDPLYHSPSHCTSLTVKLPRTQTASVQILVFCLFCMLTVGPYNGLNGLGGGGMKDVLMVTKLNTLYSVSLAICGWLGGAAFNYWGCRVVCATAGFTYLIYVAVLAAIAMQWAPGVFSFPTGIVLGIGAALLWSAFGVVSIRYPTPWRQGSIFAAMWVLLNVGGLLCGLVSLAANMETQDASAGWASYCGMLLAVAAGTLIASIWLRHQDHIVRSDGEPAGNDQDHHTVLQTFAHAFEAISDRRLLLICPAFLLPCVHQPFLFNGLNAQYFNIRSRSLNSSLYWGARIPGGLLFYFVCRQRTDGCADNMADVKKCLARRLMPGLYVTFAWSAAALVLAYVAIFDTFGLVPPPTDQTDLLDFRNHYPVSLLAIAPFVALGILDSCVQSLIYNILGAMAGDDSGRAAIFSGFYKTMQSLTVALLWAVDWTLMGVRQDNDFTFRYKLQWVIMCSLWIVAFPGTLLTLLRLRKMPEHYIYRHREKSSAVLTTEEDPIKIVATSPGEISTIVSTSGNVICLARGDYPMAQPVRARVFEPPVR